MSTENNVSGRAVAKYIRMSPKQVRRVLNEVRELTYEEA